MAKISLTEIVKTKTLLRVKVDSINNCTWKKKKECNVEHREYSLYIIYKNIKILFCTPGTSICKLYFIKK